MGASKPNNRSHLNTNTEINTVGSDFEYYDMFPKQIKRLIRYYKNGPIACKWLYENVYTKHGKILTIIYLSRLAYNEYEEGDIK